MIRPLCQSCGSECWPRRCPGCDRHVCEACRTYVRWVAGQTIVQVGRMCSACMAGAVSVPVGPIAVEG